MIRLLILTTLALSHFCWSKDLVKVFVQHELNASDTITSVGISRPLTQAYSKVYGELLASIGYANVEDENQIMQHFVISDLGVRLGYYDKLFIYVEGGVDFFEILFQDYRDQDDFYYDDETQNTPDGYAALGAGFDTGRYKLEGFVKARKLDSGNWNSQHNVFYGVQLSFTF